jgi:hypothetical protein
LTGSQTTVRGLAGLTLDEAGGKSSMVQLRADIVVEGKAETVLDNLVNRLSLEPGVRSVTWQTEDNEAYGVEDLDDRPSRRRRLRPPWSPRARCLESAPLPLAAERCADSATVDQRVRDRHSRLVNG